MFLDSVKNVYKEIDNHFKWHQEFTNLADVENYILELGDSKFLLEEYPRFSKNLSLYLNDTLLVLENQIEGEKIDGFLIRKRFLQSVISLLQNDQPISLYSTGVPRYRKFWLDFQSEWKKPNLPLQTIVNTSIGKIKVRLYNRPGAEDLLQKYFSNAWISCMHYNSNIRDYELFKSFFQQYSFAIIKELYDNRNGPITLITDTPSYNPPPSTAEN